MKADKDNFQFQHDGTEEAQKAAKIIDPRCDGVKGTWYGKADGNIFVNPWRADEVIPIITPSEALSLLQPFDRNNWCVDIRAEKDSPLLDGFKEWFLKGYRKQTDYDYKYWFIDNGGKTRGSVLGDIPIYTLSELSRLMPEIWANEYKCNDCGAPMNEGEAKTFTCCDECWGKHYKKLQPTSSEKWEPEWGKEYEFSANKEVWERGFFVAMNPKYKNDYLFMSHKNDFIMGHKHIRPVKTLRDELKLLLWGVNKTYDVDELTDKILALIEQRRG